MRISVPYTKYEFKPPAEIDPDHLALMRSMSHADYKRFLENARRLEMTQFIAKNRIIHRLTMIGVSIFGAFLAYYGLKLILKHFTPWGDPFHTMDTDTGMVIFGLALLTTFVLFGGELRSHLETYRASNATSAKRKTSSSKPRSGPTRPRFPPPHRLR